MDIRQDNRPSGPAGELDDCQRALAAARDEAEQRLQSIKQLTADLEIVRRSAAREVDDTRRYAIGPLLESLLPVRDSLERGLQVKSPETADDGLRTGIELALREFDKVLGEFGIEAIDPLGLRFDPRLHEAVSVDASSGLPTDTVCRVFEKGYLLHGRLLRPARVSVAKPV